MKSEEKIIDEIAEVYRSEIKIPANKPEKQFFLCPVGLVGAGKTTVLKPLSEKLFLVRISGDEIRKILKERGYGYDLTWNIGQKLVREFVDQGYSIAHDTDCATPRTQEYLKELSKETGAKIIWIHINPPEEFIVNKLSRLTPNWLGTGEDMVRNYYQRKPLHEHLDLPFLYTFDTSKDNLGEQIEEGIKIIKNQL